MIQTLPSSLVTLLTLMQRADSTPVLLPSSEWSPVRPCPSPSSLGPHSSVVDFGPPSSSLASKLLFSRIFEFVPFPLRRAKHDQAIFMIRELTTSTVALAASCPLLSLSLEKEQHRNPPHPLLEVKPDTIPPTHFHLSPLSHSHITSTMYSQCPLYPR